MRVGIRNTCSRIIDCRHIAVMTASHSACCPWFTSTHLWKQPRVHFGLNTAQYTLPMAMAVCKRMLCILTQMPQSVKHTDAHPDGKKLLPGSDHLLISWPFLSIHYRAPSSPTMASPYAAVRRAMTTDVTPSNETKSD